MIFFANTDAKNDEELNEKLQEFMVKYNNGEIDYTNTILDDAYELLEQAENAKSKKQAIKLAKEAYIMCPDCLDALLFQVDLEENSIKRDELLNEGLEYEKDRLEEEGYFDKENIGQFYGIFETRPYIRGLHQKANYLINDGKAKQARDVCLEILRLNNNDNTGTRYLLIMNNSLCSLRYDATMVAGVLRPNFYLKSDVKIGDADGDGKVGTGLPNDPYEITMD